MRRAVQEAVKPVHPEDEHIAASATSCGPTSRSIREAHARNAVFYGDKAIDRSPCGTGTSARMAQRVAKGLLKVGEDFVHESIIGTLVPRPGRGRGQVGAHDAIRPSIGGWARIIGHNTIFVDPRDPLALRLPACLTPRRCFRR